MIDKSDKISEFSGKAVDYDLFRPDYPKDLFMRIESCMNLTFTGLDIAEFGCGTGKFSQLLIPEVRSLFAIDKDFEMLDVARKKFQKNRHVLVMNTEAESSGLELSSVDLVLSAQAFHHFDVDQTKFEINRILRSEGKIFLVWYFSNMRQELSAAIRSCFYKFGNQLNQKNRLDISPESISKYFYGWNVGFYHLGYFSQELDFDSFIGSMRSSSYAPNKNDPLFHNYIEEMCNFFFRWEKSGILSLEFELHSYYIEKEAKK